MAELLQVGMAKKKLPKRWVENGPLAPWMVRYTQWLAAYPGAELTGTHEDYRSRYPTGDERAARASEYSGRVVQRQLVALLEKRKDLREYFDKLRTDAVYHAKELARNQVARNFRAREMALDKALDLQPDGKLGPEADVRAVETFTRPFVELAFPKKTEGDKAPQRVVINLIGMPAEQKKMLLSGVTEPEEDDTIDYEIIENEKLLTDGEDD